MQQVLVVGAGSAGLMAALAIRRKLPQVAVCVVRDPAVPVIGVGESTTPTMPKFLFEFLGISPRRFYQLANPTWKVGIHFLWGPRPSFNYSFTEQLSGRWTDLPMSNAFYCWDDFSFGDTASALMAHQKAFCRGANGAPQITDDHAFHLYNPDFVKALEAIGAETGIQYIDGSIVGVERLSNGDLSSVVLRDGRRLSADLFIDTSGFRSELLGKELAEPYDSYASTLFCDRCVVGTWQRTDEPILPFTVAETMDAGWCWRIDHEHVINRGYVFCSSELSDDQAREEMQRKNPRAKIWEHVIPFRSGRYRRGWVHNVVAIGNAGGFVEPLEATALMLATAHIETLVTMLQETGLAPTDSARQLYNDVFVSGWDEIRDFLALHYRFNTRLNTPFWKRCQNEVDLGGVEPLLQFYKENGPIRMCCHRIGDRGRAFGVHNAFGIEGHLVMLTGCKVPYSRQYQPTDAEWNIWRRHQSDLANVARQAMTVEESLKCIRLPQWQWNADVRPR